MKSFPVKIPEVAIDHIYAVWGEYQNDQNPKKVDLSIGSYHDDLGKVLKLKVVRDVEREVYQKRFSNIDLDSPDYLPLEGLHEYCSLSAQLLFGKNSGLIRDNRLASIQAVGSSGALRYVADFLRRFIPETTVFVSNPSWGNHRFIFERAGFKVKDYPYYSNTAKSLQFEGMLSALDNMPPGSVVILQSSCHNPTGEDLNVDQWQELLPVLKRRSAIALFDIAYQGLGTDLDSDACGLRLFAEDDIGLIAVQSFSKTLSMYNRRCGVLHVLCESAQEAARVLSQLKTDIRSNNSSCPIDGAEIVAAVLGNQEYRARWELELGSMRDRIKNMRALLLAALGRLGLGEEFKMLTRQNGLFSFTGLSKAEVQKLKGEYSIYLLDNGRACMASLTEDVIEYVAQAIASVKKGG